MGTRERRERERSETRNRILEAAREMFAAEGYESVTMRAIAQKIEYTPTALYHHFPGKQALVSELCRLDFEGLAKWFGTVAHISDPVERLTAIGRGYLQFAIDNPSHYRFMFMTVLPEVEHPPGYIEESRGNPERNAYVFLRDACEAAIRAGRFRPEYADPDMVAQILWATVHGLISLRIVKHDDDWVSWKDLRETAELAMNSHLHGMLRT